MKDLLENIESEVEGKLAAGGEPPWARESYDRLLSAVEAVIAGMDATIDLEDSLRLAARQETDPQQAGCSSLPNIVQLRPGTVRPLLPM